ncbi:hypothetical protein Tco_1569293 [Tanacetum coccineum]
MLSTTFRLLGKWSSKSSFHPPTTSSGLPSNSTDMLRYMMVTLLLKPVPRKAQVIWYYGSRQGKVIVYNAEEKDSGRLVINDLSSFIRRELSGDQEYWLSANEIARQASKPVKCYFFVIKVTPSQVMAVFKKLIAGSSSILKNKDILALLCFTSDIVVPTVRIAFANMSL